MLSDEMESRKSGDFKFQTGAKIPRLFWKPETPMGKRRASLSLKSSISSSLSFSISRRRGRKLHGSTSPPFHSLPSFLPCFIHPRADLARVLVDRTHCFPLGAPNDVPPSFPLSVSLPAGNPICLSVGLARDRGKQITPSPLRPLGHSIGRTDRRTRAEGPRSTSPDFPLPFAGKLAARTTTPRSTMKRGFDWASS